MRGAGEQHGERCWLAHHPRRRFIMPKEKGYAFGMRGLRPAAVPAAAPYAKREGAHLRHVGAGLGRLVPVTLMPIPLVKTATCVAQLVLVQVYHSPAQPHVWCGRRLCTTASRPCFPGITPTPCDDVQATTSTRQPTALPPSPPPCRPPKPQCWDPPRVLASRSRLQLQGRPPVVVWAGGRLGG